MCVSKVESISELLKNSCLEIHIRGTFPESFICVASELVYVDMSSMTIHVSLDLQKSM